MADNRPVAAGGRRAWLVTRYTDDRALLADSASREVVTERDEDGVVVVRDTHPPERLWQDVRDAARRCPVAAIKLTEATER